MKSERTLAPSPNGTLSCDGSPRKRCPQWSGSIFLFAVVISLVPTHVCTGADTPAIISAERLAAFRAEYPRVKIRIGDKATPSSISGDLGQGLSAGEPLDIFYGFMERNKDLFGIKDPRAEMLHFKGGEVNPRTGVRDFKFQQAYQGLEVLTAGIRAHFNKQGEFDEITASVYPNINLPSTPTISEAEAKRIVTQDVASPDTLDLSRCRLIVYPLGGKCYLAWHIVAMPGGGYLIDALSGNVLSRQPEGVFPKTQVIEPGPPIPREMRIPRGVPPLDSLDNSHRGPVGIPVDTIPPAPGSPPGTPPGVIYRPAIIGAPPNSPTVRRGKAVLPPDLLPTPVDSNSEKKLSPKPQSLRAQEPSFHVTIMIEGIEPAARDEH
ncbi:MAG: hypothetical protein HZB43_11700 [candidate division Zixibacteria bacterium]|nr:hypothetical protein [candidate division Zixibacteria bacterium]